MIKYYDCHLEAAYMAKNFGVTYSITDDNGETWEEGVEHFAEQGVCPLQDQAIPIHPDSLHIFEQRGFPKSGDSDFNLYTKKVDYCTTIERVMYDFQAQEENKSISETEFKWTFKEIVRRNNKPFIIPKGKRA